MDRLKASLILIVIGKPPSQNDPVQSPSHPVFASLNLLLRFPGYLQGVASGF